MNKLIQEFRLDANASPHEIIEAMDAILNWVDIKDPQAVDIEAAIVLIAQAIQTMCRSEWLGNPIAEETP